MPVTPIVRSSRPRASVVLPTYQGEGRITRALTSLATQTLARDEFEVIVVQNGPPCGTPDLVFAFRTRHPGLEVRLIESSKPGAAAARNAGLAAARGEYVTFVDDDDWVSNNYLASLLARAAPDVVSLAQVANVEAEDDAQVPLFDNYFTTTQRQHSGTTMSPADLVSSLSLNAAKLVSTEVARSHAYRTDLRSGEDVVYWAALFAHHRFQVSVPDLDGAPTYFREVRAGSVSRQSSSFDFSVTQRLDCIAALNDLDTGDPVAGGVLRRMRRSQAWMINQYLRPRRGEYAEVVEAVESRGIAVPWRVINWGLAEELALLYGFTPFVDTSGVVAARRIRARCHPVDVISQAMLNKRGTDESSAIIADPFIVRRRTLAGDASWRDWPDISRYIQDAQAAIADLEQLNRRPYRTVYSRSMWAPSTLAAALHKIRRPEVYWRAEFSDPLRYDISHQPRNARMKPGAIAREFRAAMAVRGVVTPRDNLLFEWCELLAYAMADEIVFTNENQRDYMLGYCEDRALAERALSVSQVSHHPTPPERFYHLVESSYRMDPERIHVGYFGQLYVSRTLTEVTDALRRLDDRDRARVQFHIFTSDPEQLSTELSKAGLDDVVVATGYRPYLEFLNLTTQFDALIVNDAATRAHHPVNPYLPSKLSDYLGSGTPIWAISEPGSVLSRTPTQYASALGDVEAAAGIIDQLINPRRDAAKMYAREGKAWPAIGSTS